MGRKKIEIERIDDRAGRITTFSKRGPGAIKKVSQLSILCDTDACVILFSPTGKLTYFPEDGDRIDHIIDRFASIRRVERAKRKSEHVEVLEEPDSVRKRSCEGHMADIERSTSVQDLVLLEAHLEQCLQKARERKQQLCDESLQISLAEIDFDFPEIDDLIQGFPEIDDLIQSFQEIDELIQGFPAIDELIQGLPAIDEFVSEPSMVTAIN